ncbi:MULTISPECIES: NADPH-dependent F420 reductase [Haloferax]|uniref:F420-dependent NADP oxidoreductase family protein n=3 Tax=Haloferax TaxID=2251 RepID=D4GRR4_HALVD|nr:MULTISPECIES: NADPH-dependent F420 reductase [Haloferax]ADE02195.1 F420-dependent NADP oxidoreductase family protein [Haloferax volcanii DS2]MBC9987641.1 NADP oxidoreductase [Haloferax sp. AS1]MBS8120457.1 NADPH-dependent F420 reductase [Haloferax volcanii]MBS8125494.1 NADPH-dependent F420 reductase [Haloferax volcanii]MBS8129361.1 NADPH-dependent F420 reductase [Haloferax volcanii]
MDIGILGAGRLGGTLAQLLVESNHEVAIANDSGVESLEDLSETLGPQLRPVEPKQAVRFGDVVFLAIPFRERDSLPDAARFAEKIVVDAMNPYTENFHVIDLGDDTSSELVASQLPDARLVKSFNTIHWETLRDLGHPDLPESERLAVFLAGDDSDAKARVAGLIRDIGFGPVDVGGLVSGGELLEPGSALYKREITVEEAQDTVQTLRARQG